MPPLQFCCSNNISHLAKAWCYWCNIAYSMGRLPLLYIPKNIEWFHYIFLEKIVGGGGAHCIPKTSLDFHYFFQKRSFCKYCGLGPRILNDWRRKWHFEERCILYNYTLFIWALCWDKIKWLILAGKQCISKQWIEVSLYTKFLLLNHTTQSSTLQCEKHSTCPELWWQERFYWWLQSLSLWYSCVLIF
jgi:hypothetical protein